MSRNPDRPNYQHDCTECFYLGDYRNHDLYYCVKGPLPTVIARWGSEPFEYASGMATADYDPILREAKRRAAQLGHGLQSLHRVAGAS